MSDKINFFQKLKSIFIKFKEMIQEIPQIENYEIVVLSGGADKGLLTLGALQYYYENKKYNPEKVHTYVGTSIGSAINLLLVCGYTPIEIFTEIYKTDNFFTIDDYNNIKGIINYMGLMTIKNFALRIRKLVESKLGFIPTLEELYEMTNKVIIITVSNITKMKCEYYSYKTKPNLSCVDAVKLSCNLPLIFQRIKYQNNFICDGGLMDNFPIKFIDDGKSKILAIMTIGLDFSQDDNYFIGYFMRLLFMPAYANMALRCELCGDNTTLVKIEWIQNSSVFQTTMDTNKKMDMFLYGFRTAQYKDTTEYLYIEEWQDLFEEISFIAKGVISQKNDNTFGDESNIDNQYIHDILPNPIEKISEGKAFDDTSITLIEDYELRAVKKYDNTSLNF